MKILVTGGLGYIGSHTVLSLLNLNHEVVIIDDLSNSSYDVKSKLEQISGKKKIKFYCQKIQKKSEIKKIFSENDISFVMHFAGLKSVPESLQYPLIYYENNISGSINLLSIMMEFNVKKFIFSSSATVYDKKYSLPWNENSVTNFSDTPYGASKIFIERILKDISSKDKDFRVGVLRYFNPIGAHKSGLVGEKFDKKSNNLVPNILRVLEGKKEFLNIYGNDYKTRDGTCIRDYFHISDLVNGHIKVMNFLIKNSGFHVWNFGSGKGYTILEIVKMFEKQLNKSIPVQILERRRGDLDKFWCDPSKAKEELDWQTNETLDTMVNDTLNYFNKNRVLD